MPNEIKQVNVAGTTYNIVDDTALHAGDAGIYIEYGETITLEKWQKIVNAYNNNNTITVVISDNENHYFIPLTYIYILTSDSLSGNYMEFNTLQANRDLNNKIIEIGQSQCSWSDSAGWEQGGGSYYPVTPVQSDWNVTTTTTLDYIKNKPEVDHWNGKIGAYEFKSSSSGGGDSLNLTLRTQPGTHPIVDFQYSQSYDQIVAPKFYTAIDMNGHSISGLTTPTSDTSAANKKYVDDTVAANDTKVKQYLSSNTAYRPILGKETSTAATVTEGTAFSQYAQLRPSTGQIQLNGPGASGIDSATGFKINSSITTTTLGGLYKYREGTTATTGLIVAKLGNSTAEGTDGNAWGVITMYNRENGYNEIYPGASESNTRLNYLADTSGWIAVGGSKGTTPTGEGSASTPIYMDTNGELKPVTSIDSTLYADTKVQQSPVSTNATYPIIFKGSTGNTAVTTTTGFTSTLYANPSTGLLYSNQIQGQTITASNKLILGDNSTGAILAKYSTAQGYLNGVSIISVVTNNTIGRFYEDSSSATPKNYFYLNNADIANGTMQYYKSNGLLQVGALGVTETTGYTTAIPSSTTGYQQGQVMFVLVND